MVKVSANVATVTAGFTFYWFDGDQTAGTPDVDNPDFEGATYMELSAGFYTVVAVNRATNCVSDPARIEVVDETGITTPTITTMLTDQTSCDAHVLMEQLLLQQPLRVVDRILIIPSRYLKGKIIPRLMRSPDRRQRHLRGLSSGIYTVLEHILIKDVLILLRLRLTTVWYCQLLLQQPL